MHFGLFGALHAVPEQRGFFVAHRPLRHSAYDHCFRETPESRSGLTYDWVETEFLFDACQASTVIDERLCIPINSTR